jgi:hypothetical protein
MAAAQAKSFADRSPDASLWWLLHDEQAAALELVDPAPGASAAPLFPRLHAQAIEMWTEAELSGLHALWWHARRGASGQAAIHRRCLSAAKWLIAELQPDNATNRPWAVHVFADVSLGDHLDANTRADASMYAQTLLHNCQVGGSIDRFSACILLDAAGAIES